MGMNVRKGDRVRVISGKDRGLEGRVIQAIPTAEKVIVEGANRVKKQTLVYKALMKFLEQLQIPVIATLRDSQAYIRSAEIGSGVFEMKPTLVREDLEQWLPLVGWLAQRKPLHIEPGSPAITSALTSAPKEPTTTLDSLPPAPAAVIPPIPAVVQSPRASPSIAPAVETARPALPPLSPTLIRANLVKPAPTKSLLPSLLKRVFG